MVGTKAKRRQVGYSRLIGIGIHLTTCSDTLVFVVIQLTERIGTMKVGTGDQLMEEILHQLLTARWFIP